MGNLARLLQHRFLEACPSDWVCSGERSIMSHELERALGFGARADVMLARRDGSRRLWIEFEISRADPVANHAKFAAAHLFEPRPTTDVFVSMVSTHVTRGRSNLAASAVYLMRAIGMAAFQTHLLPDVGPDRIHDLNQRPFDDLLLQPGIEASGEIDRALSVSHEVTAIDGHGIHFAANLFEVMLNATAWNAEIRTPQGSSLWGRRTVTYFVFNPRTEEFAPAKFCAFVPIGSNPSPAFPMASMTLADYAVLDESETRFDGHVARKHLTSRLSMRAEPIEGNTKWLADGFADWHRALSSRVTLHPRGPIVLVPPTWW